MNKVFNIMFIFLFLILNCREKSNDNLEIRMKKYTAKLEEKYIGFKSECYELYELEKLPLDTTLIIYDVYKAAYILTTPQCPIFFAYDKNHDKFIDLNKVKNYNSVNFTKIVNFKKLNCIENIEKLIHQYYQIYDIDTDIINKLTDIPGAKDDDTLRNIIQPMEIILHNNTWIAVSFSWSNNSGKILKRTVTISKEKELFHEKIEIIAKNIGIWKPLM
jgi:hypothetical protein